MTIFAEIHDERRRQDARWGQQNHLSVHFKPRSLTPSPGQSMLPVESEIKDLNALRAKKGTVTWSDIITEEVVEAVCADNELERRAELVQVAAVAIAWIECIDRRSAE
jgi:hypothetical protein